MNLSYRAAEIFTRLFFAILAVWVIWLVPATGRAQVVADGVPGRDATLIERENAKPGATDWQLTRIRLDSRDGFRSPWIEGYCSKQSVKPGETIEIMVSTDPPIPLRSLRSLHGIGTPFNNPDSTLKNPLLRLDNPGHYNSRWPQRGEHDPCCVRPFSCT